MQSTIIAFFKLIRIANLAFIFLTPVLIWCKIIQPFLLQNQLTSTLSTSSFLICIAATTLIAAAGNIINDYFDFKIDAINKPEKLIIDKKIKRRWALVFHWLFTTVAIIAGYYIASYKLNKPFVALVFPVCAILLWLYSTHYKRQYFWGNFVVALLCATVILLPLLLEPLLWQPNSILPIAIICAYAFFAFIITLLRELIKDIEDIKGDSIMGCQTIPIVKGVNYAKYVAFAYILITVCSLLIMQYFLFVYAQNYLSIGLLFAIQISLIILLFYTKKSHTTQQFKTLSVQLKVVMLAGILSLLLL